MHLLLYIHFPFCKQKCIYCDFVSSPCGEDEIESYCHALIREIRSEGAHYPDAVVDTVFFGGGTPSVVPPAIMKQVLTALRESFTLAEDVEFTSEANPGTLTRPWLDVMQAAGLNRLSIGVQAAQDTVLKSIGRIHDFAQAKEAVLMAREAGITNINTDLMFGLPGQKKEDYLDSIRRVAEPGVTHISAYSLILEEGTPLAARVGAGKTALPGEEEVCEMYEQGIDLLEKLGYSRYEVSNFAKDGFRCRHNMGYWQGAWYLGLGIAAHSMLPPGREDAERGIHHIRRENLPDRNRYIRAAEAGCFDSVRETQLIPKEEALFETVMLSLRTTQGLSLGRFREEYGIGLHDRYPKTASFLLSQNLAGEKDGRFFLTDRGMEVQNELLVRFMNEM